MKFRLASGCNSKDFDSSSSNASVCGKARGRSVSSGNLAECRSLATKWLCWTYLDLQSGPAEKCVDRLRILVERKPIRDHGLAVDDVSLEQRKRWLEGVEDCHRADDL